MADIFARLKQRKLVQWAVAYLAAAWVVLQVIDLASGSYGWPKIVMHIAFGVLALGFVVVLVLAWYHGERGVQRVNGMELLIVALILAVGGGMLWNFARAPDKGTLTGKAIASTSSPDAAQHNPGTPVPHSAATAAASTLRNATAPLEAQPISAKSVAVLPFENLSTDKANAYFADGMQDLILTKLADIGDLKVISRTSTMKYASHPEDLKTIGQQLGVATILEGSVQKAGNQVLINVQLIDTRTDTHIWAQSYTRTLDNIFGVEGEVAEKVANALNATLTAPETARISAIPTKNPAAYDAYLQGEYYLSNPLRTKGLQTAVNWYRKAVELDPKFALAWAQLSLAQSFIARDPYAAEDVHLALAAAKPAKAALDRALALAPSMPEVQLAKGWYADYVKQDAVGARVAFEAVLAMQPNNAEALFAVGVLYEHQGQLRKSLEYVQKADALAPRDKKFLGSLCITYLALRRYPQAVAAARQWVALNPAAPRATRLLLTAYLRQGDFVAGEAVLVAAPASVRDDPEMVLTQRVHLKWYQHDFAGARKLLHSLQPSADVPAFWLETRRAENERFAGNAAQELQHIRRAEALYKAFAIKHGPGFQEDHRMLGMLNALQGRAPEALQQASLYERAQASHGSYNPFDAKVDALNYLATIDALLGHADAAVKALDQLLAMPAGNVVSVVDLRLNPKWDPIHHDPSFQALLKKYGASIPAAASSGAGHG